jgi:hypothetical protein
MRVNLHLEIVAMLSAARVFALAYLAALAGSSAAAQEASKPDTPQWVRATFDLTKLPRMTGARELYAHASTTSVVVREKVPEATEAMRALLAADGWQQYMAPATTQVKDDTRAVMTFKKGPHALNIFITVAPAQGGATAIQYSPIAIENDLPFPKDATDIEFAPEQPKLALFTGGTVNETQAFFRRELAVIGWTEWLPTDPAKIVADAVGTRAITYFTRENNKPLALVLQRHDGRTMVNLVPMLAETLAAIERNPPHPSAKMSIGSNASVASAGAAHQPSAAASAAETVAPRKQARAPEIPIDVRELPRPEGAYLKDEDARKNDQHSMHYMVPAGIAATRSTVSKLLVDNGWVAFVAPLERSSDRSLYFKKGQQSVSLHFSTDGSNMSRSGVWLSSNRLQNDIPTPPGVSDVVFDDRRPMLDAIAPGSVEGLLEFFRAELTASGWSAWSAADTARYPNAKIEETIEGGVRAYFTRDKRDRQTPIQVSLGRRADNRVDIEVRVPPFARPRELKAGSESFGIPKPELIKSASSSDGQARKELKATIPAERDVVLAFYRGELAKRNWKEETRSEDGDETVLGFSSANDGTIVLRLGFAYDLTTVNLTQHLTPAVIAAKAKARRDAEEKQLREFEQRMRAPVAESESAQAATNSPLPVPAGASSVSFDGEKGELKFESTTGVPEIAGFYRTNLKKLGWRERPSVINGPSMVALDLSRGGKRLHVTIMQMGARTNVRAYGPGLVATAGAPRTANAPAVTPVAQPAQVATAPAAEEPLESEDYKGFPVPKSSESKQYTGSKFRSEVNAEVSAGLAAVLAHYRQELAKLSWKEAAGAVVASDRAVVAYAAPEGPAVLTLGRKGGKTTINVALRKPEEARKAGMLPKPGTAKIVMGSFIEQQATVAINNKSIAVGAGVGKERPDGPTLDLAPGKYRYSVKIPGKPTSTEDVTVRADQTWVMMIGPGGAIVLNLY